MSLIAEDPLADLKPPQRANVVQNMPVAQQAPGAGEMLGQMALSKGFNAAYSANVPTAWGGQAASWGAGLTGATAPAATTAAQTAAAAAPAATTAATTAAAAAPAATTAAGAAGLGTAAMAAAPWLAVGYLGGKAFGLFNEGTPEVPMPGGMPPVGIHTEDSVPAMLTPGEAVIPAPAAQNPENGPAIDAMIAEGRAANDMMSKGLTPEMTGPMSGKAKREWFKLMKEEERKDLQMMAEEARKDSITKAKIANMSKGEE